MPKNLYRELRDLADFSRSISVLRFVRENSKIPVKSGFMLGLGESESEIYDLIKTLVDTGVDILSIGQYFKPDRAACDVKRYYEESEFEAFSRFAKDAGIKRVNAGVFVRTSYKSC
jgi:lipoic acid synthetase